MLTRSILILTALLFSIQLSAQTRYWVAAGAATWSSNNWATSSGGAPDGGGPPTGVEDARFDGNGLGDCTVDVAASFGEFRMDGYTGVLDLNGNSFTATSTVILASGTINDGLGTTELTINSTDFARFSGTTFGADVTCTARGIDFDGATFNGDFTGTINDRTFYDGNGGNTFNGSFTLNLQGDGGRIRMGVNNPDAFNNGVSINSFSGTTIEFADNSTGNTINGDLIINMSDTAGTVTISDGSAASLSISGNLVITHNTSSDAYFYLGDNGDVSITGNLTYTNTSSGTNNEFQLARGTNSSVSVTGTTSITNNATSTNTSRCYIGLEGDATFGGTLSVTNTSSSNNNQCYFNHGSNSANAYNGNIVLESTGATADGIFFGNNGGAATLAASRTISIGGAGFTEGDLYLRNFTQVGATAQNISITGSREMELYDCSFGGNVTFSAPNFEMRGSTFSGTANISKTGSGNGNNVGGNSFSGDVSIINSGANQWTWASSNADSFGGNVTINNSGTGNIRFADNGGNTTVAGNLIFNNSNQGTNCFLARQSAAQLSVTGDVIITHSTSANNTFYVGDNGDVSIGGNLFISNEGTNSSCQVIVADGDDSFVDVTGKFVANNDGGTSNSRFYVCNNGDLTVGDSLVINNLSAAANSQIYVGDGPNSIVTLNGHVSISNSVADGDGVFFGNNATAAVNLAATRTISVGAAGFIDGELELRNFNQAGATAQTISLGTDAILDIESSSFGGDVVFSAGRFFTENTAYAGTASFTKNGSGDDQSNGGNTFTGDVILENAGSSDIRWGNSLPDTFGANLTLNISGSDQIQLARSSKNNTVAGNLIVNISGSSGSPNANFANDTSSSFQVSGAVTVNNNASGTSDVDVYLVNQGDGTFDDNITINNSGTGNSAQFWVATSAFSAVTMNGDLTIVNDGNTGNTDVFLGDDGDINIAGDVVINNDNSSNRADIYVADNNTSQVTIAGNLTVTNSGAGTDRFVYIGDDGDVTINGNTSLSNASNANNSFIRVGYRSNSQVMLNGNVTVEQTNVDSDEISFGDAGGVVTLSAGNLLSIGGGGFVGGNLVFGNFNQIGATPHSLTITGTGAIENIDASWGGNVSFTAPRIITEGTTYSGTSSFTKTGASNDRSDGGNTFTGDATFNHSGSDQFALGDGTADTFNGNVTYNNTSNGGDFDIGYNSAGNNIAGNLIINHNPIGGDCTVLLSRTSSSSVTIAGTTNVTAGGTPTNTNIYLGSDGDITFGGDLTISNENSSGNSSIYIAQQTNCLATINGNLAGSFLNGGTTKRIYVGNNGDVALNGNLNLVNNASSTTSELYVAEGTNSSVTISGTSDIDNNSSGTTSRFYIGNNGDITFSNDTSFTNNSSTNNSEFRIAYRSNSLVTFNGNIEVENTNATADGIRFGEAGGVTVLAVGQTITIGAGGFNSGDLQFRNFTRTGATATNLTCTGTARIYSYDANWGGDVTFIAPRLLFRGSTFSGTTTLEKTGADNDASAGGNTFVGDLIATNSGSNYLMFGNGNFDTFNANVTLNNTGSSEIYFARNGLGHTVAGDFTLNNTGTSGNTNIIVCDGGGSSLTVSGETTVTNNGSSTNSDIRLGDDGELTLNDNLTVTNTGTATTSEVIISSGNNAVTTINGNVTINNTGGGSTKRIYLGSNGDVTINGNLSLTNDASATTADPRISNGGNSSVTITGTTELTNSGTGTTAYIYAGTNGDITFGGNLTATNTSGANNSEVRFNYSSSCQNEFNGSITLQNTNDVSDGISFGRNNGVATLAAAQTISIGAGGFNGGDLMLRNFTQTGATAQTINLITNARFYPFNASFGGDLSVTAPQIYLRESTFDGVTSITQSGSSNIISYGGNSFNDNLTFTVSGTGYYGFANNSANDYNGDVTLIQTSSGYLRPDYNRDCTLSGDLNLNLTTVTRFGDAGGSIIFDGTGNQAINDLGAGVEHIFEEMVVNKSGGTLSINTPITVQGSITFTNGIVNTTSVNTITLTDNSNAINASNASHVVGPVNKQGNDNFTFPVGDGTSYRPIGIERVNNNSSEFQASYDGSNPGLVYDLNLLDGNLNNVSSKEFWILDRVSGTADADVLLSWDSNSGGVTDLSELRVAKWNGAQWVSEGRGSTSGNTTDGTITSASRVTSFSPFTLGSSTAVNPLPVELTYFDGTCQNGNHLLKWATASEINNDRFEILGSKNGQQFELVSSIKGAGTTNEVQHYEFLGQPEFEFYALRQVDFDGSESSFETIYLSNCQEDQQIKIFPNPLTPQDEKLSISGYSSSIKIHNALGKLVFEGKIDHSAVVSSNHFAKGMYIISFQKGNSLFQRKLIVY